MFALDDLARLFEVTVREDTLAGGISVTSGKQTIVLTPGQGLASVGGRLISLPAPPAREGKVWFVPVDFLSRALAPSLPTRVELRKPSRLILVGDIRVPRIAGTVEMLGTLGRLTLNVTPPTPHSVAQDGTRLVVKFDADALDATLPTSSSSDLIQQVRPGDAATLVIDLGPRFGSFRVSEAPGERGAARVVVDVTALTTGTAPTPPPPTSAPTEPPPVLDLTAGGVQLIVVDGHGGERSARGPDGTLERT
jgi:hypothetical protein